GMNLEDLSNMIMKMPQWQWELFARGVIPSDMKRGTAGQAGYFEGFMPVQVGASGAGTDPKYKAAMDAFQAVMTLVVAAGGGGAQQAVLNKGGEAIAAGQ